MIEGFRVQMVLIHMMAEAAVYGSQIEDDRRSASVPVAHVVGNEEDSQKYRSLQDGGRMLGDSPCTRVRPAATYPVVARGAVIPMGAVLYGKAEGEGTPDFPGRGSPERLTEEADVWRNIG